MDVPGSKFVVSASVTPLLPQKPAAILYYGVPGSLNFASIPVQLNDMAFNTLMWTSAFGQQLIQPNLAANSANGYFPNDIVLTVAMFGYNTQKNSDISINGQVVIPRKNVDIPGVTYYIDGFDSAGQQRRSGPYFIPITLSITQKVTPVGGNIVFPDANPNDGEIGMLFESGSFDRDTDITVNMETNIFGIQENAALPAFVYNLEPKGLILSKPFQLSLLYPDNDSNPGIVDGTDIAEQHLKIFWFDGYEWRPVGGIVDPSKNLVTVSAGHFGKFAIMPAAALGKNAYRPKERIITPALQDGFNDFAQFDNLGGYNVAIHIFDITGHNIRTINGAPHIWDGRDDDGDIVESGVYVYQFKVDGTLISGTIAVAK
jgi:hypothetical protein